MYVSWRWISEMVDTAGVDPVAFAERFTLSVAEIDGVEGFGEGLDAVRVARVAEVRPHPNADKLRLAVCDLGGESVTVVCGAPDLEQGTLVPFAPPGVKLPSGIEVRHGSVRGVESPGMLCSEADLGLSDDHGGLLRLDGLSDADAGRALPDAVPFTDTLWEIDNKSITHRPDLWGHLGVAREVAALLDRPLLGVPTDGLTFADADPIALQVDADSACRRYLCARIEGVTVAPSPVATRLRLRSLGVRPISNVVDATNLAMLETGNPLHAFDARFVRGDAIIVRNARALETLTTLDDIERPLLPTDCVIADGAGPVALAGVMGGADSEIRDDTTTVILEAASFDGASIRKTASRLGMRTESSARFEKHLDPEVAEIGARRFLMTLGELSPGCRITSRLADAGPHVDAPPAATVIDTTRSYVRSRLGVSDAEMSDAFIDRTLAALAFEVGGEGDALRVKVPTFRAGRDIGIAEDIVEELGRIYGYGRIVSATPDVPSKPPTMPAIKKLERKVRVACAHDAGLREVLLYSFDDEPARARLGIAEADDAGAQLPRLGLRNYLSADNTHLRRSLTSNLLGALERNLVQGTGREPSRKGLRVGLFEVGRVFLPRTGSEPRSDVDELDLGVPDAALHGHADRPGYLDLMGAALLEGTTTAAREATPLPAQPKRLAIAIGERLGGGAEGASDYIAAPAALSRELFQRAVGAIDAVAARCGRPQVTVSRDDAAALPVDRGSSWIHPARHGVVRCGERVIGVVSMLHPSVRGRLEVPAEVVLVEVELDELLAVGPVVPVGRAPARQPATGFDLTLTVDPGTRAARLRDRLLGAGRDAHPEILEDVRLIAVFDAEKGRALTYRVTCRHAERTLKDKELAAVRATIEAARRDGGAAAP